MITNKQAEVLKLMRDGGYIQWNIFPNRYHAYSAGGINWTVNRRTFKKLMMGCFIVRKEYSCDRAWYKITDIGKKALAEWEKT